jgi:hypothetical protein
MLSGHFLLRSQRNDVFHAIENFGFDPRDFGWSHVQSFVDSTTIIDRVTHRASGYFFEFEILEGRHRSRFSPGAEGPLEQQFPGKWLGQLGYISNWLNFLKRELDAPPLWEQLASPEPLLATPLDESVVDSPFTEEELQAIDRQMVQVRAYLRAQLDPAALAPLEAKVDYLIRESRKQGRITWYQLAIGTFVGVAMSGLMAPDQARTVLGLIANAFVRLVTP